MIDEKPYIDGSPADLDDTILKFYNKQMSDVGLLTLPQVLEFLESPKTAEYLQIGTEGVGSIQLEITCAGTVTNLAQVKLYAKRADFDKPPGVILSILTTRGMTVNSADEELVKQDIASINNSLALLSLHVSKHSGTLTDLGLEVNGTGKIGPVPYSVLKAINTDAGRTSDSDWYHLDLLSRNLLEDQAAIGGISSSMAGLKDPFNQAPIRSLNLIHKWSTKPTGDTTKVVVVTLKAVPVTVR